MIKPKSIIFETKQNNNRINRNRKARAYKN